MQELLELQKNSNKQLKNSEHVMKEEFTKTRALLSAVFSGMLQNSIQFKVVLVKELNVVSDRLSPVDDLNSKVDDSTQIQTAGLVAINSSLMRITEVLVDIGRGLQIKKSSIENVGSPTNTITTSSALTSFDFGSSQTNSTSLVNSGVSFSNIDSESLTSEISNSSSEVMVEEERRRIREIELLERIERNTAGMTTTGQTTEPVSEEGSPLGGVLSFLGGNLLKAFKTLFSPGALLKAIGRIAGPVVIISSLFSGIMDGFEEYKKSGSIEEALIAGLGGILDFLTFGLLDKENVRNVYDSLKEMFVNMFESIAGVLNSFKIGPVDILGKEFGPWYPFSSVGSPEVEEEISKPQRGGRGKPPSPATPAITPAAGEALEVASLNATQSSANKSTPTVVSAPTNNVVNQNTTQISTPQPTNSENTLSRYKLGRANMR